MSLPHEPVCQQLIALCATILDSGMALLAFWTSLPKVATGDVRASAYGL